MSAEVATRYSNEPVATGLILPAVPALAEPVWYLYIVQHPQRDSLQITRLDIAGVEPVIAELKSTANT